MALGTLLVAPARRWPAYLGLVFVATVAVGLDIGAPWPRIVSTAMIAVLQPLFVATGLYRLAGPRVDVATNRGKLAVDGKT